MALFRGDVRSSVMQMDTGLTVMLPYDRPVKNQQEPCKVLYLLHGMKLNTTGWQRYTNLENFTKENGIAVVMPEGGRSFWMDMVNGPAYYTYLSEELPELVCKMFGVSDKPEDTFASGLSMGGYAALKLALRNPERFGGAAGLSSTINPLHYALSPELGGELCIKDAPAIFGPELKLKDEDNLFELAKKCAQLPEEKRPRIISCVGTEDELYDEHIEFKEAMEKLPIDFTHAEWAGKHDWNFWEESILVGVNHLLKK